ncbi:diguanylate cyclase domain-containing protein [Edwardsiella ictaluri]|uniref:diguanylate cyclase domain-containing protein n=1 Tax=Edwardsiella ictaluri TaxID=67780 RepID=UPI003784BAE7
MASYSPCIHDEVHPAPWQLMLFAAVTYLLALVSLLLIRSDAALPSLWLPTAATTAVLFHCRRRDWPLLMGIALPASLLPLLLHPTYFPPLHYGLPHALIDQLQALLSALALRRCLHGSSPLGNLVQWAYFILIAVLAIPLLCATLAAGLATLLHRDAFPGSAGFAFMADALGMLALTPLGLLARPTGGLKRLSPLKTILILLITLVSGYYALPLLPYPFTFILMPLLWAAVALPLWPAFLIFCCTALLLCAQMNSHAVAITSAPPLLLYIPILLVLLPAHAIAIQTHAYRRESQRLEENETRLRNVMEYSAIGTALIDLRGRWIQFNPALCRMLGYDAAILQRLRYRSLIYPPDRLSDKRQLADLLAGHIDSYTLEKRYVHRSGRIIWTLLTVSLVRPPQAEVLYFVAQMKEINDIKHNERQKQRLLDTLHQERERLHITLSAIGEAVISTDPQQIVRFMNPSAEKMTGWAQSRAIGRPLGQIVTLQDSVSGAALPVLRPADEGSGGAESDGVRLISRTGQRYEIQSRVAELRHSDGVMLGYVVVFQDVSETRTLLRQLSYSAQHDPLTGLPNRVSFEQALRRALRSAIDSPRHHVLVFLDLDYFKAINDSVGHAAGDTLLQNIAQMMRSLLRPQDTLARLGGDEFAMILNDCDIAQGKRMVEQLIHKIAAYRFYWQGGEYRIGASAGLTLLWHRNVLADEVINQADAACYMAKRSGRGLTFCHQSDTLRHPPHGVHEPDAAQLNALLAAQPITLLLRAVCPRSAPRQILFYLLDPEARRPDGSPVSPPALATACLRHQRQQDIERWLFSQLLIRHAPALRQQPLALAVSLSTASLCQPTFVSWLCDTLRSSPLPARQLLLRLEESALIEHQAQTAPALNALHHCGCRLIAEGFEHRLENIAGLEHSPVEYLLISSERVAHANHMDGIMLSRLHTQARSCGLQTIAGPAELPATLAILNLLGIDLLFGSSVHPTLTLPRLLTYLDSGATADDSAPIAGNATMQ